MSDLKLNPDGSVSLVGNTLTQEELEKMVENIALQYGMPSTIFIHPTQPAKFITIDFKIELKEKLYGQGMIAWKKLCA